MTTIHLIANAHIDPIWLWPWTAGLDEVLATCRSACDRLDAHPDFIFNRGEAWVYEQVERVDPELFARIRAHVKSGRWNIVGGWWIQPDCNLPSGFAMEEQIRLGKKYFESRFGIFPRTAYNVDSFGHAAFLPELMCRHGQDRYVMMRPQEHELALPARIFRWRGREDGPEVTTFRIPTAYCTREPDISKNIQASLTELPPGAKHTMCFVGVGDHGGGPTEAQVRWCLSNAKSFPDTELVFSTPDRFFDAIQKDGTELPLATGELQMHAVGCFTVHRSVKTRLRRAEEALAQATRAAENYLNAEEAASEKKILEKAWERVAFSQFHDTLAGTCIPSAYEIVDAHLGHALSVADESLQIILRKKTSKLPGDETQRLVLFNTSGADWSGIVEVEPWFEWKTQSPEWTLVDDQGADVPYQNLLAEAVTKGLVRILFQARIEAGAYRVFTLHMGRKKNPVVAQVWSGKKSLESIRSERIDFAGESMFLRGIKIPLPTLELLEDNTDTWSHGVRRYEGRRVAKAKWRGGIVFPDQGPLMVSAIRCGKIGLSVIREEWRLYAGLPFAELLLRVHWVEERKILKLKLGALSDPKVLRIDGTMGGETARGHTGGELPMQGWTWVKRRDGNALGIVSPDTFALDGNEKEIRLSLLRAAVMAHHDPHRGDHPRARISDHGEHAFGFRFYLGADVTPVSLKRDAMAWMRPPAVVNATLGMPTENEP